MAVAVDGAVPVVTAVNEAFTDLVGAPGARLVGRPLGQVVIGGLVGPGGLLPALLAGGAASAKLLVAGADGGPVAVLASVGAVVSSAEPRVLTCTLDQEDPAAEAWRADLVSAFPLPVVVSGAGARMAFVNDRFAEVCGVPATRLLGSGWLSAVREEDRGRALDAVTAALGGEERVVTVGLVAGCDVDLHLRPADRGDGPAGFVGVVTRVEHRSVEEEVSQDALVDDLRDALATGAVGVAYQPVVDRSGLVVAVEALVRWCHPVHGAVPAGVVSEMAEREGLLDPLFRHVLRRSLTDLRECDRRLGSRAPSYVSVNVSPTQLGPGTASMVLDELRSAGLPGSRLCIELVETAAVTDPSGAAEVLVPLAVHDVRVALDDFGTGFSSISLLRALPVSLVKIDRLFVEHLATSATDRHLVAGVVGMVAALGVDVVAEGVETTEQERIVHDLGCRFVQGWLHGRAVAVEELVGVLDGRKP